MGTLDTQIAVIGGGPAGIAAALEVAKSGVHVTLLEEGKKLGGQIYKQFPDGFTIDESCLDERCLDKNYFEGKQFINQIKNLSPNITIIENALVWGIFPEKEIVFIKNNKSNSLKCKKLILAEGAYERSIPFPGWTLPGVYTTGGAQTLLQTYRVLPGSKVLLSGTGPIQLVLANQLVRAGVEVVAVLESASILDSVLKMKMKYMPSAIRQFDLIKDGIKYLKDLRKAKVPFLRSHAIIEVHGTDEVNTAIYAKLNSNWEPIPGTEKEVVVDAVCLGYGFISSTRLSNLSGCEHRYDSTLCCWIPKHNKHMETSVDGVFVAGDSAGVAGHLVAIEEGRLAGIRASRQLDAITQQEENRRISSILKKLKGLRGFEGVLNEACAIRPGLYSRITDDTTICRCEEVTAGEIRNISSFDRDIDLNEIKKITRAGMGYCQGRTCMSTIAAMVSIEKKIPIEEMGYLNYQEPTKPIRLGEMIRE